MKFRTFKCFIVLLGATLGFNRCTVLQESSKYKFNDGIYQTGRLSHQHVYVLHITDDTMMVFPVLQFKDSTAILTKQGVSYAPTQKRIKDNKEVHNFYRPSFDVDVMTIPLKYRPAEYGVPNQMTANFNGALFGGYRIDNYRVKYKRTPLNIYKQSVEHFGYSCGLFAGIGNTPIDQTSIKIPITLQYEGMLLSGGIAANMAFERFTFGVALGADYLQDRYRTEWIYEGKPCIGFTIGLDIN